MKTHYGSFRQPVKTLSHAASKWDYPRRIAGRTRHAYAQERAEQKKHLNNELASLKELLNCGSIDEDTQVRFKMLLEMSYERKREETREKYGFTGMSASGSSRLEL